ncbi:MAG TPA: TIGR04255 family protein [Rhizomicrobium sp.]|nr:TIGR04255 family protein [Rhizomicrobium sp.]
MAQRPPDLPDFKTPPVTEVVLGVQFNSIQGFLAPHLGLIWERFKRDFPHLEEHPLLPQFFETFGTGFQPQMHHVEFFGPSWMPRVFFINEDRTQLLQVQRDRFLHNWRKIGMGDAYPRFEKMIETFGGAYAQLESVLVGLGLGRILPNQCEVTYINQIEVALGQTPAALLGSLFGQFWSNVSKERLGEPEDANIQIRYIIRHEDTPVGRVSVQALPARRADGAEIVQMTFTARGLPLGTDFAGVKAFLELGRGCIVHAFTELTSPEMHKSWERVQ